MAHALSKTSPQISKGLAEVKRSLRDFKIHGAIGFAGYHAEYDNPSLNIRISSAVNGLPLKLCQIMGGLD
jgi:hypothetical protein